MPAVVVALAGPARAHPHVWIHTTVAPTFDAGGRFVSVHEKWVFDYDFSAIAKYQADKNVDGRADDDEMKVALSEGLSFLSYYDYFSRLTIAGRQVAHGEPEDVVAKMFAGKLTVEFTLPLATPGVVTAGAGVDVFDPEFYYAIDFDYPDIEPVNAPASCVIDRREQPNLDPVAVMLIRKLGLSADPSIINDPAAGYDVRVAIDCGGSPIAGLGAGTTATPPAAAPARPAPISDN